eukprot:scaffold1070_cov245-Pinguiococcus_pyrenoidosus.AAC.19
MVTKKADESRLSPPMREAPHPGHRWLDIPAVSAERNLAARESPDPPRFPSMLPREGEKITRSPLPRLDEQRRPKQKHQNVPDAGDSLAASADPSATRRHRSSGRRASRAPAQRAGHGRRTHLTPKYTSRRSRLISRPMHSFGGAPSALRRLSSTAGASPPPDRSHPQGPLTPHEPQPGVRKQRQHLLTVGRRRQIVRGHRHDVFDVRKLDVHAFEGVFVRHEAMVLEVDIVWVIPVVLKDLLPSSAGMLRDDAQGPVAGPVPLMVLEEGGASFVGPVISRTLVVKHVGERRQDATAFEGQRSTRDQRLEGPGRERRRSEASSEVSLPRPT